jgi:hypothetical protein
MAARRYDVPIPPGGHEPFGAQFVRLRRKPSPPRDDTRLLGSHHPGEEIIGPVVEANATPLVGGPQATALDGPLQLP